MLQEGLRVPGDFEYLNGYDEDAFPMGSQDADLIDRLVRLGRRLMKVKDPRLVKAIPNSIEAKISNINPVYGNLNWSKMNQFNWDIFSRRSDAGQLIRNSHVRKIGMPLTLLHAVIPASYLKAVIREDQVRENNPIDAETWRWIAQQPSGAGQLTILGGEAGQDLFLARQTGELPSSYCHC